MLIQIQGLRLFWANQMSVFWFALIYVEQSFLDPRPKQVGKQVPSLGGPWTVTFAPSATKQYKHSPASQLLPPDYQMPLGQNWPRVLH